MSWGPARGCCPDPAALQVLIFLRALCTSADETVGVLVFSGHVRTSFVLHCGRFQTGNRICWAVLGGRCWLCLWRWSYSLWCVVVLVTRVWRQQWSSSLPTCICIATLYVSGFSCLYSADFYSSSLPDVNAVGQARSMQFTGANVASDMLRIFLYVDVGLKISQSLCAKQSWMMLSLSGDQS